MKTSDLNLPRITIDDTETDKEIASFYGPNAARWVEEFQEKLPGIETGRYGLSVSDDGCTTCGQLFWHEARVLVDNHPDVWACPYCGATEAVDIKERLEYLRGQLRAECISYYELHELQGLAEHIEPGDVELLEAAGVPELES